MKGEEVGEAFTGHCPTCNHVCNFEKMEDNTTAHCCGCDTIYKIAELDIGVTVK